MSVLERAIGWLAPPQCLICSAEGSAICANCSASGIEPFGARCWRCGVLSQRGRTCPACQHIGGPRSVWISTDYDDIAQKLVWSYKFEHLRAVAEPLAQMMAQTLLDSLGAANMFAQDYLLVPVPTATARLRQRGFDHSALLAKLLARNLRLHYSVGLARLGQSRQLGAKREERLRQLAGSFIVKAPRQIAGRNILLIDDVITTGGTIIEATKTLRAAGAAHVDALLFAKRL